METHAKIRFGAASRVLIVTVVVFLSLALAGCTTVKKIARAVTDPPAPTTGAVAAGGSGLRQKIVVAGISKSQPAGFAPYFVSETTERLQKDCRDVMVVAPAEVNLTAPPLLPTGETDGFALALLGRRQGVNFFVFGTLNDLRFIEEKKGFWWWKDDRYALRAVIRVEVFDSVSGAKSRDESLWEEMELDELGYQQLKDAGTVPLAAVAPILEKLLRRTGPLICTTVRSQPWQEFVVAADRDRFTISSGAAVGLAAGRTLEVFAKGRTMEGKDGRRFLGPGEKIGEATVSGVADQRAEAAMNAEGRVQEGATVRLKR
jgi:hypothetical protein